MRHIQPKQVRNILRRTPKASKFSLEYINTRYSGNIPRGAGRIHHILDICPGLLTGSNPDGITLTLGLGESEHILIFCHSFTIILIVVPEDWPECKGTLSTVLQPAIREITRDFWSWVLPIPSSTVLLFHPTLLVIRASLEGEVASRWTVFSRVDSINSTDVDN